MFNKIRKFVVNHKIIAGAAVLVVLIVGFYGYKALTNTSQETRYTVGIVEKGTIVSSVTGSGQVSASNELNISPKISGDLIYLPIVAGQAVYRGQLLAKINTSNAQQAVTDAQRALDQASLDLEKMKGIETSLGTLRGVKEKAQDSLNSDYVSGYNTIANAFINLPTIMTGLQSILFDYTLSRSSWNIDYYTTQTNIIYRNNAYNSYQLARTSYEKNFNDYKITNRTSSTSAIEALIDQTYDTVEEISQTIKDTTNLIQSYQDELTVRGTTPEAASNTHLTSLNSYLNTTNSYFSSLLSIKNTLEADKESLINTDYTITDQEALVTTKQTALDDAKTNLSYCFVYSPFNGIISAVNSKNGDSVSTGTAIAKIITKEAVAEISLNEIDAAKVKIGQKTTITFDAISDLTLTGKVIYIDAVGTVSQGVVSYIVKINFDTQDDRIKPGMSVSVAIITDSKQNVLVLSNSAVKSQGGAYYVEVFGEKFSDNQIGQAVASAVAPNKVTVEVGISDDNQTEIISGVKEGDQVVVKTTTGTVKKATTGTNANILNMGGGRPN